MRQEISRWMQVKRFTRDQVLQIHVLERAAELRWKARDAKKDWAAETPLLAARGLFDQFNAALGRYWAKSKLEEERKAEIEAFERAIYPIWRPKEQRYHAGEVSELDYVHSVDLAVLAMPHVIDYGPVKVNNQGEDYHDRY